MQNVPQNPYDPYAQGPSAPQTPPGKFGNYPPQFPIDPKDEEKKSFKRAVRWRVFLAVFLTAAITFLITAGIVFALYGDALREIGGNRLPVSSGSADANTLTFSEGEEVNKALAKFSEVYSLIQNNYIDELSDTELIELMTQGLVDNMDSPYTFYLTADENQASKESMSGEYSGIGAVVMMDENGYFVVNDVVMGSPAEDADVAIGDRIIAVEGESTSSLADVNQLASLIRGEDGTEVTVTFFRSSENREFDQKILRRKIINSSLSYSILEDGIAYVRLTEFSSHAAENFREAVSNSLEQGARHMIIDLRGNGGGYAHECIDMLSVLLQAQTIATVEGRSNGKAYKEEWKTEGKPLAPDDMTYVILLNRYSASASELFSGVLRDLGKATLIGEKTYGKGVGTLTWSLPDESAVQITNFEYFLPKGQSINGIGLLPDEEILLDDDVANKPVNQLTREEDTQLSRAIEILSERLK